MIIFLFILYGCGASAPDNGTGMGAYDGGRLTCNIMVFEVYDDDVEKIKLKIKDKNTALGGYVSQEIGDAIVMRVPNDRSKEFGEFLNDTGYVEDSSYEKLDVTEQYEQIEAKIVANRESLDRYRRLMKNSDKVDDSLRVADEIERLTAKLANLEADRKKLLEESTYTGVAITFNKRNPSLAAAALNSEPITPVWVNVMVLAGFVAALIVL